ncbi:MAG: MotA/TolQ/ExbB proton channel family protein [Thermodesulfobacteriota bacterium]|nr:MotA/TolQ/ExbB proton channel family protein [Thermodesulfobacteriota bacterium]
MRKTLIVLFVFFALGLQTKAQAQVAQTATAGGQTTKGDIGKAQAKAQDDVEKAATEAAQKKKEILGDRKKLAYVVKEMEKERKNLSNGIESYERAYKKNDAEIERLNKTLGEDQGEMDEITGLVRGIAQDLRVYIRQSPVSSETPGREKILDPLIGETEFPTLENIGQMADLMQDEISRNGQIVNSDLAFMDSSGRPTSGEVTRIGAFNVLFRKDDQLGYLEYSPSEQSLHEISVALPGPMKRQAERFLDGTSPGLFVDLSGGGALRQLTDMPSWRDEIRAGGVLMYPIFCLGFLALVLICERFFTLSREGRASGTLLGQIAPLLNDLNWEKAEELVSKTRGAFARVLGAGISHRKEPSEVVEAVMEEEIQSVLPIFERNMRFLQILGMVAPLMGLLGTVTGMITTFQMITLYGTGDPKMMSGGISEALVTTMYGLIMAIPIMLFHGYLGNRSERLLGTLEEKSLMLVNTISRSPSKG